MARLSRCALLREHPSVTEEGLAKAREFNFQRYHYQGIGRFAPDAAYARGVADLRVLANLLAASDYLHGAKPTSVDAGIYGFIANILYYAIEHPAAGRSSPRRPILSATAPRSTPPSARDFYRSATAR